MTYSKTGRTLYRNRQAQPRNLRFRSGPSRLDDLREDVQSNPQNPQAWAKFALQTRQENDYQAAAQVWHTALNKNPSNSLFSFEVAKFLYGEGKIDGAVQLLTSMVEKITQGTPLPEMEYPERNHTLNVLGLCQATGNLKLQATFEDFADPRYESVIERKAENMQSYQTDIAARFNL